MIEEYYSNILFVNWVLLLITSSYFLIGKVPDKPVYKSYRTSRKIMGITMLIFCVHFFVHWKFELRNNAPQIAAAFNLTSYYVAGILFGMSFISLLDGTYLKKERTTINLSKWVGLSAIMWCAVLFLEETTQRVVLVAAALFFLFDVGRISLIFFRTYKKAVTQMQNYYSEDIDSFIRWMSKSTFGTIAMGLTGAVMAFMPKWTIAIYATLGILLFFYIFICFMDYLVDSDKIEVAVVEPNADSHFIPEQKDENSGQDRNHTQIEANLPAWLKAKSYLKPGLTIEELAGVLETNRTYLSSYINETYGCTFRKWIAGLRLEEAKVRLLDEQGSTVTTIAEAVGFSSSSYFTSLFTEKENQTPAKWREDNARSIS